MDEVTLDWSSAEVRDRKLEVALQGELPPGWKDSFNRTLALLPGGDWGKVKLKRDRVRVGKVGEGSEDRLHHFLESVVQQATSARERAESEPEQDRVTEDDELDERDVEMTKRFRSFAAERTA
jgi:hypothetical protein